MTRIPFTFRLLPGNRFTLPLLLSVIENSRWAPFFNLSVTPTSKALLKNHSKHRPGIVAYSFMTTEWPDVWRELRRLKSRLPETIFIAGGPHPTGSPDLSFKTGFHTIFQGEAEETLLQFCDDYLNRPDTVQGHIYIEEKIVDFGSCFPVSNTFDFIPPLEITRGCHYHCSFCQTGRIKKPVYRSIESIQSYFDKLKTRKRIQRCGFICPSGFEYGSKAPGIPEPERIEIILAAAKQAGIRYLEYGIFPSEIRPGTVSQNLIKLIKKYCSNKKITLGAQTGTKRMLYRINRGHSKEAVEQSAAMIREHGMTPVIDFIIGLPGELPEDQLQSLEWIKILNNRYQVRCQMHHFIPLAGTAFEMEPPAVLDSKTVKKLKQLQDAGICTSWWMKGRQMAARIINLRNRANGF